MNVIEQYVLPPGCCYYCLGQELPALDLQRDDEDNPNKIEHIYLCPTCLAHAARIVLPAKGFQLVATADVAANAELVSALRMEADLLAAERDKALAARDALVASYGPPPEPFVAEVAPDASRRARRGVG